LHTIDSRNGIIRSAPASVNYSSGLPLLDSAFDKAIVYGRSVYDNSYVALALEKAGNCSPRMRNWLMP
jgi:predicted nucleic acid-binding protein